MNCWKWKKGGVLVRVSFAVKRHGDQETHIKENFFIEVVAYIFRGSNSYHHRGDMAV